MGDFFGDLLGDFLGEGEDLGDTSGDGPSGVGLGERLRMPLAGGRTAGCVGAGCAGAGRERPQQQQRHRQRSSFPSSLKSKKCTKRRYRPVSLESMGLKKIKDLQTKPCGFGVHISATTLLT